MSSPTTARNPRQIVDISAFTPFNHPEYGPGAVREITYLDGTIERRWLHYGSGDDPNLPPDAGYLVGTPTVDPKIRGEWDRSAPAAAAAKPSNVYVGINPSSGKPSQVSEYPDPSAPGGVRRTYDDTQVPAGTAKAGDTDWHTEGRPDGQGGFDNSRPIMVRTVNGARETREPTGAELKDWNVAGQIQRNPGGQTDEQVTAATRQAEADRRAEAERTRPGAPTLKPDGKGGTVAVQVMPDGTIKTTPLPGVPSDAAAVYTDIKQDPKTGAWTGLTKDGQWVPISGGPGLAPEKPTIRPGAEGRPDIQYVPDPKNPGQVIAVPIQGTGTSTVGMPPGFARPTFSPMQASAILGETQSRLDTWVSQATDEVDRRARQQKATELMTEAHREATTYLNEQQIGTTTARDVYGTQVSERGQTIGRQNQLTSSGASMASQAVGSFLPQLRYAQAGAGDPARALLALMGLMNYSVGSMGGLEAAPANVAVPGILGPYLGAAGAPGVAAPAGVAPGAPGAVAPGVAPAAAAPREMTASQGGPAQPLPVRNGVPVTSTPAAAAPAAPVPAQPVGQGGWGGLGPPQGPPVGAPDVYHAPPGGQPPPAPDIYRGPPPGGHILDPERQGFQGMQQGGGMPPLAIMQALLDRVEPMMQADPSWGVNDLAEIQLGRSPWG